MSTSWRESTTLITAVRRMEAVSELADFGATALAEIAELVPFDHGVFNEVDPRARHARFDIHPPGAPLPPWSFDTFDRYLPRNPIFQHSQRHNDGSARRLSDFLDDGDLESLPLYTDILEPLGLRYQVAFSLAYRRPLIAAFSLNRADADFSDDEVAALDLIRPHLSRIYRRLRQGTEQKPGPLHIEGSAVALEQKLGLTRREAEVLADLAGGATLNTIAARLGISESTVRTHLEHVYRKLGVTNRASATAAAAAAVRS